MNRRTKDGRQSSCRSCKKAADAASHQKHRERRLVKRRTDAQGFRKWLNGLKENPCTDCGNRHPYFVMQWDHLPGAVKLFTIGTLGHKLYNKERVLDEIAKCELVCANCHATRTHRRRFAH